MCNEIKEIELYSFNLFLFRSSLVDKLIDGPHKCGEGLAASGGSGYQDMIAGGNLRPTFLLYRRGRTHARLEPLLDQGVKEGLWMLMVFRHLYHLSNPRMRFTCSLF